MLPSESLNTSGMTMELYVEVDRLSEKIWYGILLFTITVMVLIPMLLPSETVNVKL